MPRSEEAVAMAELDVMTESTDIADNKTPAPNGAEPADILRARNFIRECSADPLSLRGVARAAGLSAGHLSEKFKNVTGSKFVDYVARIRFEKACECLAKEQKRVSEIAFEVGFQSLSQFNRIFKKLSGKSPTEYRQALRQKEQRSERR